MIRTFSNIQSCHEEILYGYSIQQVQQSYLLTDDAVVGGTKNWDNIVEIVATTIIMVSKQQEKCFMNSVQSQQYSKRQQSLTGLFDMLVKKRANMDKF